MLDINISLFFLLGSLPFFLFVGREKDDGRRMVLYTHSRVNRVEGPHHLHLAA